MPTWTRLPCMNESSSPPIGIASAEQMHDLGARIAHASRPGDVIVLIGDLGAGKTTLVQGIGRGLGVREAITSPTFVIARVHRTPDGTPDLVHVDAYRLGSAVELDDLDLDADVADALTVIEWGEGKAEQLSSSRLSIRIVRSDDVGNENREVHIYGHGPRWAPQDIERITGR